VVILTNTPPPTRTPIPTATPTVAQWIAPYTIEGLRQHDFQSGEVSILATLDETEAFTRFLVAYPSDGLSITAILQIPKQGQAPFPVIVMNHGFFTRADFASGDGTDRAAEYLNRHGYLTISSDYRSWGDSDSGPSLFYSGLAIDVVNLIRALPSIPQADPTRVGLWGHSMGGGVTMKVLTLNAPVRAAVLYSTVSADNADLVARWGMGCVGDIAAGEARYGCNSSDILPDDLPCGLVDAYQFAALDADLNQAVSPYYHLGLVEVPVQIHFGTEDGKEYGGTPPAWSKKLHQGLVDAGRPAELFAYEGEGHSFFADQWVAFMERSARFFDLHVKGTP
jgi:dipeptidyl aminopeptidase/acylaminoacyl peptidase